MIKPTYTITLRALPRPGDQDDPGALVRLRRTLKALLRGWGWRCVDYRVVKPESKSTAGMEGTGA